MKLTNRVVNSLEAPAKGYRLAWDTALPGFGVRVTQTGVKSYIAEGRVNGRTRRVTLGRHGVLTADQARRMAREALGNMLEGIDPTAERKERQARAVTLAEVAEDYKANRRTRAGLPLKDRTKRDIDSHLRSSFADWANRPVTAITREMILRRYAERCKASVAQANQAMRVLSAIINYTMGKYHGADGGPIIAANPVNVLRETSTLRAVQPRNVTVPLERLGEWWSALTARRADPALTRASKAAADCIALVSLTGLRIGEARAITWQQLDMDAGSLSLTDTKNRTDVVLPLSQAALEVLQARLNDGAYVFPARSGKGHLKSVRDQLQALAQATGIEVTAHDLRRTFIQVGFKVLGVELWRMKLLANHKVPKNDVTLAAYGDLSDRMFLQAEADRIGAYFEQQRLGYEAGNVIDIRGRRTASD